MSKKMSASTNLLRTSRSAVLPVARVGLALVILPHGLQKTVGWFGGFGFAGTMDFFTDTMGIPYVLGLAAIVAESLGALLLLVGLGTRLWAGMIGATMLVALLTVHLQHGFFMNWFGNQAGEGAEFFLLAIALAMVLVVGGGGSLSLDRRIVCHRRVAA
jgi:putative oxidoreductase